MTETIARKAPMIMADRMKEAEYFRRDWVVNAEQGTEVADVLEPLFWTHMAKQMDPYDRIEVRLETGDWIVELVVVYIEGNTVHVKQLQRYDLANAKPVAADSTGYEANFGGPHHRWRVLRKADGAVLEKGLANKDSANEWIAAYERRTARA